MSQTILIIEDNSVILKILQTQLEKAGFSILTSTNGRIGMVKAREIKPALIIVDSILPNMDGFEFCKLAKKDPEISSIPLIIISNFEDSDDIQEANNIGVSDYIIKFNITPQRLIDRVKSVLSGEIDLSTHSKSGFLKDLDREKGEMLFNAGIITRQQLDEARKKVEIEGITLAQALCDLEIIFGLMKYQVLELFYGADYVDLSEYILDMNAVNLVSVDFAKQFSIIPIKFSGNKLLVALGNPMDVKIEDHLKMQLKRPIKFVYTPPENIEKAISIYYGANLPLKDIQTDIKNKKMEDDDEKPALHITKSSAPIIQLVDTIITQAIAMRGSDIHFEPKRNSMLVRYRIDGILHDMHTVPGEVVPSLVSRIKILADLDISERRRPQDGRIGKKMGDTIVDIRVSILPVVFGEKIVMRILDKSIALYSIADVGLRSDTEKQFCSLLKQTGGMMLVTGPTGSGKTTTLYAALNYVRSSEVNIISLEDPVEFVIDGVNQIAINPKIDLTFASALRSVLRQDPNIIMVGEIRDLETADLAIQAALTGHLVLGTLHTRNAPGAITRLIDMGVPSYLVASTLVGVIAQRLVRKICDNCKETYKLPEDSPFQELIGYELKRGIGCDFCHHKGYHGRIGVFEAMFVSDKIRKLIVSQADISELTSVARSEGMTTLREDALWKVKEGISTPSELARVV